MEVQIQKIECPFCARHIPANSVCCPMCGLDLPVGLPRMEQAEAEAKERALVKEQAEARARAEAEDRAQVKAQTAARAQAEEQARAKEQAEAQARAEAWARAKGQAEEKARATAKGRVCKRIIWPESPDGSQHHSAPEVVSEIEAVCRYTRWRPDADSLRFWSGLCAFVIICSNIIVGFVGLAHDNSTTTLVGLWGICIGFVFWKACGCLAALVEQGIERNK